MVSFFGNVWLPGTPSLRAGEEGPPTARRRTRWSRQNGLHLLYQPKHERPGDHPLPAPCGVRKGRVPPPPSPLLPALALGPGLCEPLLPLGHCVEFLLGHTATAATSPGLPGSLAPFPPYLPHVFPHHLQFPTFSCLRAVALHPIRSSSFLPVLPHFLQGAFLEDCSPHNLPGQS